MTYTKARREIGTVAVDSGQVLIVDPCYILDDEYPGDPRELEALPRNGRPTYNAVCLRTLADDRAGQVGLGVASSSGWGDGCYPVYAEFDQYGQVARLTIEFIGGDDEDEVPCAECGVEGRIYDLDLGLCADCYERD